MSAESRIALFATIVCAVAFTVGPKDVAADEESFAQAPFTYYAPVPDYRDPMRIAYGYLVSYRVGSDYGQAVFHDGDHRQFEMIVGGNFTVEGQVITCIDAPSPSDSPSSVTCPDWPRDIVLGRTPVAITYWMSHLGDKPVAVLQSLAPYRP